MPFVLAFVFFGFLFVYLEISLLVWIADKIGILGLILLLILSSFAGLMMIRARGWYTLLNVQKQLAQGEIPARSLLKSGIWIAAGALFFIPGLLTDILAILLLTPMVGAWIEKLLVTKFRGAAAKFSFKTDRTFSSDRSQEGEVFEAEYEKQVDEDKRLK